MDVEAVVIGAGAIGLATARRLAENGHDVVVIEAEKTIGQHTSSRNSEVIHAGMYYPQNSLKARMCVAGREALYRYCADRGVPAKAVGKLVVATHPSQVSKLQDLAMRGLENGVNDLRYLTAVEAREMEPALQCVAAIHSPSTGIIDAHAYMLSLHADAEALGALFAFNTRVIGVGRRQDMFLVRTAQGDVLQCAMIVNCAGLWATDVARSVEGLPADKIPPRFLAKGNYFSVSGATPFTHLIYPMPVDGGLGVHVTLDMSGRMRLGPDVHWTETIDYTPVSGMEEAFRDAVLPYWPGIATREIASAYCGIRPKISGPQSEAADFRIDGPDVHGVPGLVNCFGIESPGLTSSLAIADHIYRAFETE